jgi:hypothetical protein
MVVAQGMKKWRALLAFFALASVACAPSTVIPLGERE